MQTFYMVKSEENVHCIQIKNEKQVFTQLTAGELLTDNEVQSLRPRRGKTIPLEKIELHKNEIKTIFGIKFKR